MIYTDMNVFAKELAASMLLYKYANVAYIYNGPLGEWVVEINFNNSNRWVHSEYPCWYSFRNPMTLEDVKLAFKNAKKLLKQQGLSYGCKIVAAEFINERKWSNIDMTPISKETVLRAALNNNIPLEWVEFKDYGSWTNWDDVLSTLMNIASKKKRILNNKKNIISIRANGYTYDNPKGLFFDGLILDCDKALNQLGGYDSPSWHIEDIESVFVEFNGNVYDIIARL